MELGQSERIPEPVPAKRTLQELPREALLEAKKSATRRNIEECWSRATSKPCCSIGDPGPDGAGFRIGVETARGDSADFESACKELYNDLGILPDSVVLIDSDRLVRRVDALAKARGVERGTLEYAEMKKEVLEAAVRDNDAVIREVDPLDPVSSAGAASEADTTQLVKEIETDGLRSIAGVAFAEVIDEGPGLRTLLVELSEGPEADAGALQAAARRCEEMMDGVDRVLFVEPGSVPRRKGGKRFARGMRVNPENADDDTASHVLFDSKPKPKSQNTPAATPAKPGQSQPASAALDFVTTGAGRRVPATEVEEKLAAAGPLKNSHGFAVFPSLAQGKMTVVEKAGPGHGDPESAAEHGAQVQKALRAMGLELDQYALLSARPDQNFDRSTAKTALSLNSDEIVARWPTDTRLPTAIGATCRSIDASLRDTRVVITPSALGAAITQEVTREDSFFLDGVARKIFAATEHQHATVTERLAFVKEGQLATKGGARVLREYDAAKMDADARSWERKGKVDTREIQSAHVVAFAGDNGSEVVLMHELAGDREAAMSEDQRRALGSRCLRAYHEVLSAENGRKSSCRFVFARPGTFPRSRAGGLLRRKLEDDFTNGRLASADVLCDLRYPVREADAAAGKPPEAVRGRIGEDADEVGIAPAQQVADAMKGVCRGVVDDVFDGCAAGDAAAVVVPNNDGGAEVVVVQEVVSSGNDGDVPTSQSLSASKKQIVQSRCGSTARHVLSNSPGVASACRFIFAAPWSLPRDAAGRVDNLKLADVLRNKSFPPEDAVFQTRHAHGDAADAAQTRASSRQSIAEAMEWGTVEVDASVGVDRVFAGMGPGEVVAVAAEASDVDDEILIVQELTEPGGTSGTTGAPVDDKAMRELESQCAAASQKILSRKSRSGGCKFVFARPGTLPRDEKGSIRRDKVAEAVRKAPKTAVVRAIRIPKVSAEKHGAAADWQEVEVEGRVGVNDVFAGMGTGEIVAVAGEGSDGDEVLIVQELSGAPGSTGVPVDESRVRELESECAAAASGILSKKPWSAGCKFVFARPGTLPRDEKGSIRRDKVAEAVQKAPKTAFVRAIRVPKESTEKHGTAADWQEVEVKGRVGVNDVFAGMGPGDIVAVAGEGSDGDEVLIVQELSGSPESTGVPLDGNTMRELESECAAAAKGILSRKPWYAGCKFVFARPGTLPRDEKGSIRRDKVAEAVQKAPKTAFVRAIRVPKESTEKHGSAADWQEVEVKGRVGVKDVFAGMGPGEIVAVAGEGNDGEEVLIVQELSGAPGSTGVPLDESRVRELESKCAAAAKGILSRKPWSAGCKFVFARPGTLPRDEKGSIRRDKVSEAVQKAPKTAFVRSIRVPKDSTEKHGPPADWREVEIEGRVAVNDVFAGMGSGEIVAVAGEGSDGEVLIVQELSGSPGSTGVPLDESRVRELESKCAAAAKGILSRKPWSAGCKFVFARPGTLPRDEKGSIRRDKVAEAVQKAPKTAFVRAIRVPKDFTEQHGSAADWREVEIEGRVGVNDVFAGMGSGEVVAVAGEGGDGNEVLIVQELSGSPGSTGVPVNENMVRELESKCAAASEGILSKKPWSAGCKFVFARPGTLPRDEKGSIRRDKVAEAVEKAPKAAVVRAIRIPKVSPEKHGAAAGWQEVEVEGRVGVNDVFTGMGPGEIVAVAGKGSDGDEVLIVQELSGAPASTGIPVDENRMRELESECAAAAKGILSRKPWSAGCKFVFARPGTLPRDESGRVRRYKVAEAVQNAPKTAVVGAIRIPNVSTENHGTAADWREVEVEGRVGVNDVFTGMGPGKVVAIATKGSDGDEVLVVQELSGSPASTGIPLDENRVRKLESECAAAARAILSRKPWSAGCKFVFARPGTLPRDKKGSIRRDKVADAIERAQSSPAVLRTLRFPKGAPHSDGPEPAAGARVDADNASRESEAQLKELGHVKTDDIFEGMDTSEVVAVVPDREEGTPPGEVTIVHELAKKRAAGVGSRPPEAGMLKVLQDRCAAASAGILAAAPPGAAGCRFVFVPPDTLPRRGGGRVNQEHLRKMVRKGLFPRDAVTLTCPGPAGDPSLDALGRVHAGDVFDGLQTGDSVAVTAESGDVTIVQELAPAPNPTTGTRGRPPAARQAEALHARCAAASKKVLAASPAASKCDFIFVRPGTLRRGGAGGVSRDEVRQVLKALPAGAVLYERSVPRAADGAKPAQASRAEAPPEPEEAELEAEAAVSVADVWGDGVTTRDVTAVVTGKGTKADPRRAFVVHELDDVRLPGARTLATTERQRSLLDRRCASAARRQPGCQFLFVAPGTLPRNAAGGVRRGRLKQFLSAQGGLPAASVVHRHARPANVQPPSPAGKKRAEP
ncbi:hypothetical protein DIPPA_11803, partial [Diplonema papillatum]